MKIKDGFIMKNVAGSNVVLPLGERQEEVKGIITFNDVGADVFNMLTAFLQSDILLSKLSSSNMTEQEAFS